MASGLRSSVFGRLAMLNARWHPQLVRALAILLPFGLLAGCPSKASVTLDETPIDPALEITPLSLHDDSQLLGVSGADLRSPTEVWLAPERTGSLVALPLRDDRIGMIRAYAIEGLPSGTDVEALAFLDRNRLLLGTEARGQRTEDPVFVAEINGDRVTITSALIFDYAPFGLEAGDNQGIEGLCTHSASIAVAASEAIQVENERRFALVGIFYLPRGPMVPQRVELASEKGKLSALACQSFSKRDIMEVYGIERHFGTMRLVRFEVSLTLNRGKDVKAELVADLAQSLGPKPPNLEGLVAIGPGEFLVVSDNHYGRKTGPTKAFLLTRSHSPDTPEVR